MFETRTENKLLNLHIQFIKQELLVNFKYELH